MRNILVTGGLGFIGSHTVVELAESGYNPVIIDNLSNSKKSVIKGIETISKRDITFYKGDFHDLILLTKIFITEKIDGVIHFAAHKAVGESVQEPIKYYRNNVAGLIELLDCMQSNNIHNFVFSSSCTVYGEPDHIPIDESAPVKPATSPYGASKQMDEVILKDISRATNLHAIALRYFNPIGAHSSGLIGELPIGTPANLVPFITQAAAGLRTKLIVNGSDYPTHDGTCVRDYIHVMDLAKAHIKALEYVQKQKGSNFYDVINLGTGTGNSVLDVITTFEKVTNKKVPYEFGPRRDGDIISTYADATKAREILGWQTELTLDDALKDAWNWQCAIERNS